MARRLIFGPVLIALLIGLMWLDERLAGMPVGAWGFLVSDSGNKLLPGLVLLVLGLFACARGGYELARLFRAMNIEASSKSLSISAAAGVLAGSLTIGRELPGFVGPHAGAILATSAILAVFLSMLAYIRHKDPKGAATAVAAAGFALLYIGLTLAFLIAIRREFSVWAMVAVIFTVKACDSGAYFTGTAIGKHKLIPWISPGKTWEGLIGGLITSALFGVGFVMLAGQSGAYAPKNLTWIDGVILGTILGLVGQAGDLSASVIKRDAGVKDAGRILPGFGGLIDMLDSLLIAAPVAYWYLELRHVAQTAS